MAFRFQKRIKLLPGVTLNVSKGGVSTSIGVKGARVTYGRGKKRTTVGVPGTGISHTTVESTTRKDADVSPAPSASSIWPTNLGLRLLILVCVAVLARYLLKA